MNRRKILQQAVLTSGRVPVFIYGQKMNPVDPLPPKKLKDFVIAGHCNFDKVKRHALAEPPTLLYATWPFLRRLKGPVT